MVNFFVIFLLVTLWPDKKYPSVEDKTLPKIYF